MRYLLFVILAIATGRSQIQVGRAQSQDDASAWSEPVSIAQTGGALASSAMVMLSDRAGTVHLFFPHKIDESTPDGIDHMSWASGRWTEPVNVLFNQDGSAAHYLRGLSDGDGRVHLVWIGGNNRLYYSSARADQAGSGHAWLTPFSIAQSLPTQPGIAAAPDGSLWLAYADATRADAISLLRLASPDDGWMTTGAVVDAGRDIYPGHVSLAIDDQGRLHLTWTTLEKPSGWPPAGVFYARSLDQGLTWHKRTVAEGDYGQSGVVNAQQDEVHIFWSSTVGGDGTYHQFSLDGGQSWSRPRRFMERGGFSGLPSFAVDSAGGLHYMRGSSVYAMWDGSALSDPQPVTTDEVCIQGQISCGERAQMAITGGNLLHAVFETDFNQLWYATKGLATPELPAWVARPGSEGPEGADRDGTVEAPTETHRVTDPSEQPQPSAAFDLSRSPSSGGQMGVLLLGVLPALLLVLGVSLMALRRRRRRPR
jgi:hypothetical protein